MRLDVRKNSEFAKWALIDARTGLKPAGVCWVDDNTHQIGMWVSPKKVVAKDVPKVVILVERLTILINVQECLDDVEAEATEGLYAT